jgi:uncharacterized protein (TIGR02246 family)
VKEFRTRIAFPLLASLLAGLSACVTSSCPAVQVGAGYGRPSVIAALEHYMTAARAVDPDAIAACFAPTGLLLEPGIPPIEGREAIREFIVSFPGVDVQVAIATADVVEVFGDTALIWGSYFERLAFPGQPLSVQHGRFVIEWVRGADGGWLILRFFRIPVPTPAGHTVGGP